MLNTENLLKYLGLSESDEALNKYFSSIGVSLTDELKLEGDSYRAYIERPNSGYCLVFTDEASFFGIGNQAIGIGKLFFSTVFFYSEGKDGYSKYQSDLPFNLSFDDDREVVLSKLGEPSWQRFAIDKERVISDRWDNLFSVPYRLHVTYSKDDRKISIVSVTIPDKPIS